MIIVAYVCNGFFPEVCGIENLKNCEALIRKISKNPFIRPAAFFCGNERCDGSCSTAWQLYFHFPWQF